MSDELKTEIEGINGELAALYLTYERKPQPGEKGTNRRRSPEAVRNYAKAMLAGEWQLTHQGIAFHKEGHLVDGGHRLSAVVEAAKVRPDIVVPFMVTYGLTDEAILAMDIGKRRLNSDYLTMEGEVNANMLASTVRLVYHHLHHPWISAADYKKFSLSPQKQRQFLDEHPDMREAVHRATNLGRLFNVTASAALWFLAANYDPEGDIESFFSQLKLGTGPNWERGNPIYSLRELLVNAMAAKRLWSTPELLALKMKAYKAWREGREIKLLSFRGGEEFPRLDK